MKGKGLQKKVFDETVTFQYKDKQPYGSYIAFDNFKTAFPKANNILVTKKSPLDWDSLSVHLGENQVWFLLSKQFYPTTYEWEKLLNFVRMGNTVFISTIDINDEVADSLDISLDHLHHNPDYEPIDDAGKPIVDKGQVKLSMSPIDRTTAPYGYLGFDYSRSVLSMDTQRTYILGTDEKGNPNFIKFKSGKGSLLLHTAPFAFTNYFLLQSANKTYFDKVVSTMPANAKTVVWDDFYPGIYSNNRNDEDNSDPGFLGEMMKIPAFKTAFWMALLLVLLYFASEAKRKQRIIPVYAKPKNESLDFVKTIGRLYFDKKDNHDLCLKMTNFFLEHVRNKYKMTTNLLNEDFVEKLAAKSGQPPASIHGIVQSIDRVQRSVSIDDPEVASFHQQLEQFYGRTT
jgi:hypothetical protein